MQDKTLTKISLIISLVGILILLLLLNIQQPELLNIENINGFLINKNVQIQGNIISIKDYNNFQILTVQDKTGEIQVLINKKEADMQLNLNKQVTVIGRLSEYNKELQINADKILQ